MGAWIFQGNPKTFPAMDDYLRRKYQQSTPIQWLVGRTRFPVRLGDRAFMWRAEGGR